jgi:hypothetical protein
MPVAVYKDAMTAVVAIAAVVLAVRLHDDPMMMMLHTHAYMHSTNMHDTLIKDYVHLDWC